MNNSNANNANKNNVPVQIPQQPVQIQQQPGKQEPGAQGNPEQNEQMKVDEQLPPAEKQSAKILKDLQTIEKKMETMDQEADDKLQALE